MKYVVVGLLLCLSLLLSGCITFNTDDTNSDISLINNADMSSSVPSQIHSTSQISSSTTGSSSSSTTSPTDYVTATYPTLPSTTSSTDYVTATYPTLPSTTTTTVSTTDTQTPSTTTSISNPQTTTSPSVSTTSEDTISGAGNSNGNSNDRGGSSEARLVVRDDDGVEIIYDKDGNRIPDSGYTPSSDPVSQDSQDINTPRLAGEHGENDLSSADLQNIDEGLDDVFLDENDSPSIWIGVLVAVLIIALIISLFIFFNKK